MPYATRANAITHAITTIRAVLLVFIITVPGNALGFASYRVSFCPKIITENNEDGLRIATVYCHGYEHSGAQARRYLKTPAECSLQRLILGTVVVFDFADAGRNPFRFNRAACSMGQQNEIERVHAAIQYAHALDIDAIVVYGVSRGAAAAIGALGTYGHQYNKVCAAVLESPFANLNDVIKHIRHNTGSLLSLRRITSMVKLFCARHWDCDGPAPIDFVKNIPNTIAIQFLATDTDHLVPLESTYALFEAIAQERDNIHFDCITNARHGHFTKKSTVFRYANILKQFYGQYVVPETNELQLGSLNASRAV